MQIDLPSVIKSRRVLLDIRFWLITLAIARLYAITLPPLEFQHAWRQADGLMIARNFVETDSNIFYPRVDTAGDRTGITGSEFPVLNYLIYLVSIAFSYQHWYGRLIVLIFSTIGSFFFYKSIRKFFSEATAFSATIILTASYWFSYSRKVFPDCFAFGLCFIALYYALEYLEKGKPSQLLLYVLLGSIGSLSKISAAIVFSVLALPIINTQYPKSHRLWILAASGAILISISGWYFIWVPHLNETYGYGDHFTMGCPLLSQGWEEIRATWRDVIKRLFIVPMKYLGLIVFLCSLIYILYRKKWSVFALFIIPYACFLFIILKTGKNIISDQYYVLSAIPAMALVCGYGLAQLTNKSVMLIILAAIAIENIGDQLGDFRVHRINAAFSNLEAVVDKVSSRNDLIVINSDPHCATVMYFAHRKGWTVNTPKLKDQAFIEELKSKNCKYVLICKSMYGNNNDAILDLPQVFDSDDFRIYSLK